MGSNGLDVSGSTEPLNATSVSAPPDAMPVPEVPDVAPVWEPPDSCAATSAVDVPFTPPLAFRPRVGSVDVRLDPVVDKAASLVPTRAAVVWPPG
ncbi:hypothetical protein ASF60_14985 [Methylobacterium sp. Leaf113]|nr:hypothetical protein ASF60_14985 [Methylobacterium sp. Leaf113]